jgi:putative tryptophan/tyrosine transport system substrate-binding protein
MASTADDPDYQARIAAFQHGLQQLGWSDGRNVHIDTRWATASWMAGCGDKLAF